MAGLHIYNGNRLDLLVRQLAEIIRVPLDSPFTPEIVVVQSKGMERWVAMELASIHGICANCRFPFPNAFVREIFTNVVSGAVESQTFDPAVMTWKLMRLVECRAAEPGFEPISDYLAGGRDSLHLLQLCRALANLFDQYLLFRPELVLAWEQGREDHWQARLWRELAAEHAGEHRAALRLAFLSALEVGVLDLKRLPTRVSVFGISHLPPFHLEVLAALSRVCQVHLFWLNPCREYWGDLPGRRELRRASRRVAADRGGSDRLYLDQGNSLLASMGVQGRDFFDQLLDYPGEEREQFEDPGNDTLLHAIQSDIWHLRERGAASGTEIYAIAAEDHSVEIHSCHSPMREVEVLHERLLGFFEQDPQLLPKDILVMAPDIEKYAPYIQAVFDGAAHGGQRIPFTVADRSVRRESRLAEAFLSVLDLYGTRFTAPDVLAVLDAEPARARFQLSEADLDLIRGWVKQTRICWGLDAAHRGALGLPDLPENTWRAGLDRLLLGYALPGAGERLFAGILPYDDVEGGEAHALGCLAELIGALEGWLKVLEQPRSVAEWATALSDMLGDLFEPGREGQRDWANLERTLAQMAEHAQAAGFDTPVDIRLIRWHLARTLEGEGFGYGFLSGGVTFCAMLPMRSIPFRIICLLGMDGDAYPRIAGRHGFDLIARHPRRGDRSRRDDDRYLFLEALLSARHKLIISYVGQSVMDNSVIPPSVLISELLDYLDRGFRGADGRPGGEAVVTSHPLQPFSPRYFQPGTGLSSYSDTYCRAAQNLMRREDKVREVFPGSLAEPDDEWKRVELDDLCRFFANPCRYLLTRRLGILLPDEREPVREVESFSVEGLERYLLRQDLLGRRLRGRPPGEGYQVMRGAGLLPHGRIGERVFDHLEHGVEAFLRSAGPYLEGRKEPVLLNFGLSGCTVTGRIDNLYDRGQVFQRFARVRRRDLLAAWIRHLALHAGMGAIHAIETIVIGLDPKAKDEICTAWRFAPVSESDQLLGHLLDQYWQGLCRLLPFFPESSGAYAEERRNGKDAGSALRKARQAWQGDEFGKRGEKDEPHLELCFGERDPLDTAFEELAVEVFEPLLARRTQAGET